LVTKKSQAIKKRASDGEVHFILVGSIFDEATENATDFDETEMRAIMRKEASKPLLLLRAE
jgi:hypothetical protein